METNRIYVWLYSEDTVFSEVTSRELGTEFKIRHISEFSTEVIEEHGSLLDVIVVNLQEVGNVSDPKGRFFFLRRLLQQNSSAPVIVLLDEHNRHVSRKAMEEGAYATMVGHLDIAELRLLLRRAYRHSQSERELQQLRPLGQSPDRLHDLIGFSEPMQKSKEEPRRR